MKIQSLLKSPQSKILKSGRVILSPGEEIGRHVTHDREEFLIILRGTAILREENKEIKLIAGETYYVAENVSHNILNTSDEELEYIYVVGLKRKEGE